MVIQGTVKRIRGEYKAWMEEMHPDWVEKDVAACVKDAFYPYSNTIFLSFWKCFADNASMERARAELFAYFTDAGMANQAEEQTETYWNAMKGLKEFFDSKGGVKACVGPEYDCEETVYQYAKQFYEGGMTATEALEILVREVPAWNQASHYIFIQMLSYMMKGICYKRRANTETILYFITRIGQDYGREYLTRALRATWENVRYYYEQVANKSHGICRGCARIAAENQVDMDFSDHIFEGIIPKTSADSALAPDPEAVRYWLYAADEDRWARCLRDGVMTMDWGELGDLTGFESREDLRVKLKEVYGDSGHYKDQVQALWQFASEVKEGDIIYAAKGRQTILCRGVAEGAYTWDPDRGGHTWSVRWGEPGEWVLPEAFPVKPLPKAVRDISSYSGLLKTIEDRIGEEVPAEAKERTYESYTEEDFLRDVFMDRAHFEVLRDLLFRKKNLILQGAPGVGKTYAAMRLAYAIMGEKDRSRVQMVQFHQSYSYEDFIMGYRPTETGFTLKTGVFYEFCRRAADDDRPYFFLIDEINRGNLSKILGELFMLIESDKRGVELQLLYGEERFSIPANVYIIGMMNTADRSLAMLDYALRRRFAFFDMPPAFDSAGFRAYMKEVNQPRFTALIDMVEQLNRAIAEDESLGEGFRIGHSYFYTREAVTEDWMKKVVEYELIPLLREYWFDEPAKVRAWSRALREVVQ